MPLHFPEIQQLVTLLDLLWPVFDHLIPHLVVIIVVLFATLLEEVLTLDAVLFEFPLPHLVTGCSFFIEMLLQLLGLAL